MFFFVGEKETEPVLFVNGLVKKNDLFCNNVGKNVKRFGFIWQKKTFFSRVTGYASARNRSHIGVKIKLVYQILPRPATRWTREVKIAFDITDGARWQWLPPYWLKNPARWHCAPDSINSFVEHDRGCKVVIIRIPTTKGELKRN